MGAFFFVFDLRSARRHQLPAPPPARDWGVSHPARFHCNPEESRFGLVWNAHDITAAERRGGWWSREDSEGGVYAATPTDAVFLRWLG